MRCLEVLGEGWNVSIEVWVANCGTILEYEASVLANEEQRRIGAERT